MSPCVEVCSSSVLQRVAVCCSVLQCVVDVQSATRMSPCVVECIAAVRCSVYRIAVGCGVLQCVAVCCSGWQSVDDAPFAIQMR